MTPRPGARASQRGHTSPITARPELHRQAPPPVVVAAPPAVPVVPGSIAAATALTPRVTAAPPPAAPPAAPLPDQRRELGGPRAPAATPAQHAQSLRPKRKGAGRTAAGGGGCGTGVAADVRDPERNSKKRNSQPALSALPAPHPLHSRMPSAHTMGVRRRWSLTCIFIFV